MAQNYLGLALSEARGRCDITQLDLALRVSCADRTVRQAEAGQGNIATYLAMVDALGWTITGKKLPAGDGLGVRLGTLRKRRKISIRTLAEMAEVSPTSIVAIEAGKAGHLAVVEKIATALEAGLVIHPKGKRLHVLHQVLASNVGQELETPSGFLERLYPLVGGMFDLDPSSPTRNKRIAPVKARKHYTVEDDGLSLPWCGSVFCNPPFKKLAPWLQKAHDEAACGVGPILMLIPFRPNTKAWMAYVAYKADVISLLGRMNFSENGNQLPGRGAPMAMCLVVWNWDAVRDRLRAEFSECWYIPAQPARASWGPTFPAGPDPPTV